MGIAQIFLWRLTIICEPSSDSSDSVVSLDAWRLAVRVPRQVIWKRQRLAPREQRQAIWWQQNDVSLLVFVCVIYKALVMLQRFICWCSLSCGSEWHPLS